MSAKKPAPAKVGGECRSSEKIRLQQQAGAGCRVEERSFCCGCGRRAGQLLPGQMQEGALYQRARIGLAGLCGSDDVLCEDCTACLCIIRLCPRRIAGHDLAPGLVECGGENHGRLRREYALREPTQKPVHLGCAPATRSSGRPNTQTYRETMR